MIILGYPSFRKLKRIQKAATIVISFFMILICIDVSLGDDIARKFEKLKEQYHDIDTIYIESEMTTIIHGTMKDFSGDNIILRCYKYWANKHGNYRITTSVYDSNGVLQENWDFAYNGNLFQLFDKRALIFSYSKKDPKQNPCAPENPLFAPLLFLGQNDDNCPACTLKLTDVLNTETWEKVANAKIVTMPNEISNQTIVEIPGNIIEGKEFVFHVYFANNPDYLPSKINWVDTATGDVIISIEVTYKAIDLNGKWIYWPRSIHYYSSGQGAQGNISVEFDAVIKVCQINRDLPPDIFTIDSSSAKAIWDNDAKILVEQKGN